MDFKYTGNEVCAALSCFIKGVDWGGEDEA